METPHALDRRIAREKTAFEEYAETVRANRDSKCRRGREKPVNRRKPKVCPLCGSLNRQMSRHLRQQHGHSSSARELRDAFAVVKVRKTKVTPMRGNKCRICGQNRVNLRSHMILAHSVPPDSELLKSGKLAGPRAPEHQAVGGWLAAYRRVHFNSLDGAVQSAKPATRLRTMKAKLSRLSSMLDVIVSETGAKTLSDVVRNVKVLVRLPDGYFQRCKVKASTVLKDVDTLNEFLTYAQREELVEAGLVDRAKARLASARGNLKRQSNVDKAEFQAQDGSVTVLQPDIDKFRASKRAQEAVLTLSGGPVSKRSAINCRNFLMAEIFLGNAIRPSAIVGLTRAGLREARRHTSHGVVYAVLSSASSKTTAATGEPLYTYCDGFNSELCLSRSACHGDACARSCRTSVSVRQSGSASVGNRRFAR